MLQRNFKLYDFPVHSVCFLHNFFFRSEQKVPSVLYHCAKFKKISPSTFRDIFGRNLNFPKISRVQDCYLLMRGPGAHARIHATYFILRWLPPVLHFPESLNSTKGFLTHHDGLVPVVARWCYNSFFPTRGQNTLDLILTNLKPFYNPPFKRPSFGRRTICQLRSSPKRAPSSPNPSLPPSQGICDQANASL